MTPQIETRVRSKNPIDRAMEFCLPVGKTGVVIEANNHIIRVKMDEEINGCADEYENCVIYVYDGIHPLDEEFWMDFEVW